MTAKLSAPLLLLVLLPGCRTATEATTYSAVAAAERGGPASIPANPRLQRLAAADAQTRYTDLLEAYTDTGLDQTPGVIAMPLPEYPASEQKRRVWGDVTVVFVVDEAGGVEQATVTASPSARLAEASLAAIRRWRFKPMTREGKPVKVRFTQVFPFRLP